MARLAAIKLGVACIAALMATSPIAAADDALLMLRSRNPYLDDLSKRDPATFTKAALLILRAERAHGLTPEHSTPPQTAPVGRGMKDTFFTEKMLPENPDLLWLYNASPEGMSDLIGLLKSAGNRPKT